MDIRDGVVVVTGASSGIGRETALALAHAGAHPVLLARRRDALNEVAERCRRHGARPVVAPADVTDGEAVQQVADTALQRHGRLDGWVNAASVMEFGTVLDVPPEDVRRVLDVNLMGAVHGCRAALPPMIAEGRGSVVNVSSILGVIALPFGAGYTMTKFGLRGLGVSLRQELRLNGVTGVGVSTVLPAAVDTPIWSAAGNRTGRTPHPPPPVADPGDVARAVLDRLRDPRRETVVGALPARALVYAHALLPEVVERVFATVFDMVGLRGDMVGLRDDGPVRPGTGNLFAPVRDDGHGDRAPGGA